MIRNAPLRQPLSLFCLSKKSNLFGVCIVVQLFVFVSACDTKHRPPELFTIIFSLGLALTFEDKGNFQSHFRQIQTPKHILKNKLTKIFPTKDYNPNKTPPFAAAVQMPVVIFKLELPVENNNLSKVITVDDLDNSLILET